MTLKHHLSATCCAVLAFAPATAAVLPSLDRATFQAAAPALTTQNFDSFADGATLTNDGQVTYSSPTGTPVITNFFTTSTAPNGLGLSALGFFASTDTITFTFANAITAFGIDINTFASSNGAYAATLNTGDQAFSIFETFPGVGTGQFLGFVSNTPFTSVTVQAGTGFSYTLDTLRYGAREVVLGVPEPATWAMMLMGFGGVGYSLRRRPAVRLRIKFAH